MNQTIKPLWNHQVEGINRGLRQKDLGLFFEQGTGKSRTMIEVLRRLYAKENRVMRTLILCPIIVCENWKKEFGMYSKINHFDIVVLKGPGRKRVQDFLEIVEKNKIVITNYEAMENKDLHLLLAQWCEILVCDESQRLKNPDSVRAKKVVQIADLCLHRYILTGTPILNSCSDVFMQFRILDGGETFGKNYYAFRHEYFEDANARRKGTQGYFPDWKPKPFTFEVLQDRISHKAMRVLKSECLDLPPFVNQRVDVELGAEQKRMYKQMMNDYVTWLKTKDNEPRAVVAQLAVTKAPWSCILSVSRSAATPESFAPATLRPRWLACLMISVAATVLPEFIQVPAMTMIGADGSSEIAGCRAPSPILTILPSGPHATPRTSTVMASDNDE